LILPAHDRLSMALVDSKTNLQGLTCEPCRRRKIKCDKHSPCSNCTRHNILCSSQIRKRGRPTKFTDDFNQTQSNSSQNPSDSNHNTGMSNDEKRFHGIFLFCQSVCQHTWSPITLKLLQTVINSGIVRKSQHIYQMIEDKLKSIGLDLATLESTNVTETEFKDIEFEKYFNEICTKQINAVRIELSNQKMICFRLLDNTNGQVYFIVNREFHNFFIGGTQYSFKYHQNILSNSVVRADYHHLFYSCGAVAMLNLTGQSEVIVQCFDSRKCVVPCQVTFRVLSLSPNGISCCAIEFQPLVLRHATYLLDNNTSSDDSIEVDRLSPNKRKSNELNVISDLFDILALQQKKSLEALYNSTDYQIPLKIPSIITQRNNDESIITSSSSTTSIPSLNDLTIMTSQPDQPVEKRYYQMNQKRLLLTSSSELTEPDSSDEKHDDHTSTKINPSKILSSTTSTSTKTNSTRPPSKPSHLHSSTSVLQKSINPIDNISNPQSETAIANNYQISIFQQTQVQSRQMINSSNQSLPSHPATVAPSATTSLPLSSPMISVSSSSNRNMAINNMNNNKGDVPVNQSLNLPSSNVRPPLIQNNNSTVTSIAKKKSNHSNNKKTSNLSANSFAL